MTTDALIAHRTKPGCTPPTYFPDDFILPGEFRWSPDGVSLVGGDMAAVTPPGWFTRLVRKLARRPATPPATDHERRRAERTRRATLRRDSGLPPLFWMLDKGRLPSA